MKKREPEFVAGEFAKKYGGDEPRIKERRCEVCGKVFTPPEYYPMKRVCSRECSEELIRRQKKSKEWDGSTRGDEHWREKVRKCVVCGREFRPRVQRQVCCCPNCNTKKHYHTKIKAQKKGKEPKPLYDYRAAEKECVVCGKVFEAQRNQKTCSEKCAKERQKQKKREWFANMPKVKKVRKGECVVCGKGFEYSGKGMRKTCSAECRKELKNKKQREFSAAKRALSRPRVLECVVCGKEFMPHGRQITCSAKCARKRNKQKCRENWEKCRAAKPVKICKCAVCGKEFEGRGMNTVTCSGECRQARHVQKMAEWWRLRAKGIGHRAKGNE